MSHQRQGSTLFAPKQEANLNLCSPVTLGGSEAGKQNGNPEICTIQAYAKIHSIQVESSVLTVAPSKTVAPMPTRAPSSMVAACIVAP